ncbi:MAG: hypothetical protein ACK49N_00985 [Verrucomicrobiota bacterium]
MKQKYNRFLPLAALAILTASGHVLAQYSAENSALSFADTKTSTALTTAVALVSNAQANALNTNFNNTIAELNGADTVLGSAARYQKAQNDLAANPSSSAAQAELDLAQTAYSNNITSVNNLKAAAKIDAGTSFKTFNGVPGASLQDQSITASEGAIATAVTAATNAGNVINDAVTYYKAGAGATTVASSKADLQGEVIDKLTPITAAAAADVDANGFKLTDVTAYNTAATNLTTAQTAYTTAINDPTSTSGAIATAAADLASKENAYTAAISTLYANYSPITDTAKTALVETVLNGSWERDAIKSNSEGLATTKATADATKAKVDNATTGLDATKAIADATKDKVDNATTGLDATKAIADATKAKVDNATTGLDATKAIADATKAKVDNATTGLDATKAIADATKAKVDNATTGLDATKAIADATKAKVDHGTTGLAATKKIADDEVAIRTALIREENGQIHIGQNSLVTSEAGGFQELSAQDALGGSLDINVTNGSDLRIDGVSVATDDDISAIRNEFQAADRNLRNDIDTNTRGIAMVAAMTNTTIRDGMTQGVDFNISQFEGETGFAFGYAHKINENMQLHGAAASTTDFEESVGRLGVSFQW